MGLERVLESMYRSHGLSDGIPHKTIYTRNEERI
jgi:hypothetical protein